MRDLRAPSRACGTRFALAAVALALFGLLSMHGWGSHAGTHSMGLVPPGTTAAAGDHSGSHSHAGSTDPRTTGSDAESAAASMSSTVGKASGDPDGRDGSGLIGLCLAVLSTLLLGVALFLARQRLVIPRDLLPTWPHRVFIGRDRDPPDLLELSVIRC